MSIACIFRTRARLTVVGCILAAACVGSSIEGSSNETLHLALEPCRLPDVGEPLSCGVLEVSENRRAQTGRRIGIHVTVARATGPAPVGDPLILFSGGPGLGASRSVPMALTRWGHVRRNRDLVFVDLRGTGKSHPLGCRLPGDRNDPGTYLRSMFEPDVVRTCRDSLATFADLAMYTTTHIAADVDDVRRALGYEAVNVYGVSYGSLVAQEYLRRHGEHVRTAILHAPVPTTGDRLLLIPELDSLVARTVSDCVRAPACLAAYPDVESHLEQLTGRIVPDTVTAVIPDQANGGENVIRMPYTYVAELLQVLLYSVEDAADLPALLGLLANERFAPLVPLIVRIRRGLYSDRIAWGLYLSVYCAEMLPYERSDEMLARAHGSIVGDGEIRELLAACALWPRAEIPSDFREPVVSPVSTLILSGELDPVTPPVLGESIAQHLSNVRHLVMRNTAHEVSRDVWDTCLDRIVTQFIEEADGAGLDVACTARLRRPQFAGTGERNAPVP